MDPATQEHKGKYPRFLPVIAFFFMSVSVYAQATLLVFIPGKQNVQQIQNALNELMGAGNTLAFGRIKDLDATMITSPDAAIIASEPFFRYTPGYTITLIGKANGSTGERYHIIAVSRQITLQNIGGKKVGIVDFLGKDRLPLFVKDQFGVEIKMLKRVNKEEDLLTMIGMEAVDAIIVSTSQLEEIQSNTKLSLSIVASSVAAIGLATCGQKKGKNDERLKETLLKAPAPFLKEIGIDGWELR